MWRVEKAGGKWWLVHGKERFRMVGECVAVALADYLNGRKD